jgi:hypothetical protein
MDFGAVLSRAWKIIWRHKVLWVFGILAGCASAASSGPNLTYQTDLPYSIQNFFDQASPGLIAGIIIAIVLIALALTFLVVFLGTIGRIGLIRGTQLVDQGTETLAFRGLFRGSMRYFWRVFALALLLVVFSIVVIGGLLFLGILGTVVTLGLGLICLIPLLCLLIPVGWFLSVLFTQATIAIVVDDVGVMEGLARGWEVIKKNVGSMIVMALILVIGLGAIATFIIAAPLGLIMVVALPATIALGDQATPAWWIAGLCFVVYLPVLLLLSGILRAYIDSAWTLTYLRLTHPIEE